MNKPSSTNQTHPQVDRLKRDLGVVRSEKMGHSAPDKQHDIMIDLKKIKEDIATINHNLGTLVDKINLMSSSAPPPTYNQAGRIPSAFLPPNRWQ